MQKVLIQLDTDQHASSFDSITAIDAGVDSLLTYSGVTPNDVRSIVHGAMFTRGIEALKNTAIFVGGTNVSAAESILTTVRDCFFGRFRVSAMLDANGCNTTASAAVVCLAERITLSGATVVVMGSTGPVGRRVCKLLGLSGASVIATSRSIESAEKLAMEVNESLRTNLVRGTQATSAIDKAKLLRAADGLVACGSAGVELVDETTLCQSERLQVAIDLNAVPPAGIGGIDAGNKAKMVGHVCTFGAIGVGGLKMKTHSAAIQALFESNDNVLREEEIFEIAKGV
ncbi:Bifunctional protein MdtA [Novipirellula aureliae]|uniref:Bifunctional protein MdtA n=1 Tax=Novipirellula aureliae TaxID=2527966 RepID=A0A5C6DXX4_9BACT|nr:NAD(P)-dependent methylenetetrahydromethanopterin dehydrogenase [Novipirellula aureliae]TWU41508.1 Bifunctional protein MdtA [Novipirellula aureliae]